ncbi:hypothetical protein [Embleya sp. AB8]|uniref:hypothetical protein n=1 Tax=Embleya sp. AB8 TaxID=3156304 RepID=UPI003C7419C3
MNNPRVRNEFHRAVQETGLTYAQLAADIRRTAAEGGMTLRTNSSAITHWVNGKSPAPETAVHIAEVLSRRLGRHITPVDLGWTTGTSDRTDTSLGTTIGPDPIEVVRRIGEADINRRQVFTAAAYSVAAAALPLGLGQTAEAAEARQRTATGGRFGRSDIAAVRAMLQAYTSIDERQGGQHGRSAVVQYLRSDVADLTHGRFAGEADHRDALTTAAAVTYLAGWKSYDAGEHGLAQRYYLQAFALTRAADDPLHTAWILRTMANGAMDIGRHEHTLDLADAALSLVAGRSEPGLLSLFVSTRAQALATVGRGPEAVAEIRRAQDLTFRGEDEELPFWAGIWCSHRGTVASTGANCFRSLRDHANAEKQYAGAASSFDVATGKARVTALTLSYLGREQAAQGHLEQACGTWGRALDYFGGVHSDRAAQQVSGIRRQLAVFERRGVGPAAHLDQRARHWQLAHA